MKRATERMLVIIRKIRRDRPDLEMNKLMAIQPSKRCRTIQCSIRTVNKKKGYVLEFNPTFVNKLLIKLLYAVVVHEAKHIKLKHLERLNTAMEYMTPSMLVALFNDACDLEVNQHMPDKLPKGAYYPGRGHFKGFPKHRTAEEYFLLMLERKIGIRRS